MDDAAARGVLEGAMREAIAAVMPGSALAAHLPPKPAGRLVVVGAGKAAAAMSRVVEEHYLRQPESRSAVPGDKDGALEGLVVTRYGHELPTRRIEVAQASHPVPDDAGVRATERILELAAGLGRDDLLLCLISGGASALLTAPDGVSLSEKAELTRALLRSGADITEMNMVRKHLSRVKGGRLAAAAAPARVVSLIISDVAGDDLSSIGSGPTVPDPSTFADALAVLDRYDLKFPRARAHLRSGSEGILPETPKPGDPEIDSAENLVVAGAQTALEAAAAVLRQRGITPLILSESLTGEAREAAKFHAALVRQILDRGQPLERPCALLSGGETTVTVRGRGRGGRNGEFLLALALELRGAAGVHALAADTDGIDGSEQNAGAVIGPDIFERVPRHRADDLLAANDSYAFFEEAGALVVTGPTHTNVNDLRIIVVC